MKKTIIALALMATSGAAIASAPVKEAFKFDYRAKQEITCSMVQDNQEPELIFTSSARDQDYGKVTVVSTFAKSLKMTVKGKWEDVTAWGGKVPDSSYHVKFNNEETKHDDSFYHFTHTFKLQGGNSISNDVVGLALSASEMTHAGSAHASVAIELECSH
ncbi:MAG: hypothetical protein ACRC6V_06630 [Bacteroidales bacterium]